MMSVRGDHWVGIDCILCILCMMQDEELKIHYSFHPWCSCCQETLDIRRVPTTTHAFAIGMPVLLINFNCALGIEALN